MITLEEIASNISNGYSSFLAEHCFIQKNGKSNRMSDLQVLLSLASTIQQKEEATSTLSKIVAQSTGKPESHVLISIVEHCNSFWRRF
jgi:hypothetical protein